MLFPMILCTGPLVLEVLQLGGMVYGGNPYVYSAGVTAWLGTGVSAERAYFCSTCLPSSSRLAWTFHMANSKFQSLLAFFCHPIDQGKTMAGSKLKRKRSGAQALIGETVKITLQRNQHSGWKASVATFCNLPQ